MEVVQSHLQRRGSAKQGSQRREPRLDELFDEFEDDSPVKVENVDVVGSKLLEGISKLENAIRRIISVKEEGNRRRGETRDERRDEAISSRFQRG